MVIDREHLCETDNWIIITFDCSHISLSVAREVFACVVSQHNLTSTPFGMDTLAVFDRRFSDSAKWQFARLEMTFYKTIQ